MNVTHSSMHSLDTSTGCLAAANAMSSRKSLVAPSDQRLHQPVRCSAQSERIGR